MNEERQVTRQGGGPAASPEYAGPTPTGPFVLSLVSGVLILLGALVPLVYVGNQCGRPLL